MRAVLKWIAICFLGIVVLCGLGLLYIREALGGAFLYTYISPNHPENRVEIYDYDLSRIMSVPSYVYFTYAFYVVDSGRRRFLGEYHEEADTGPWNTNLFWTPDGEVIYCKNDDGYSAAYDFEEHKLMTEYGLGAPEGLTPTSFDEASFRSFLYEHGGEGTSTFKRNDDQCTYIWRDFVPSERN